MASLAWISVERRPGVGRRRQGWEIAEMQEILMQTERRSILTATSKLIDAVYVIPGLGLHCADELAIGEESRRG